jgi:hypothetical protein
MNNTQDWPVSFKSIVGIAGCVIGLGVVYFGYGIGTESPNKDAAAQARPARQDGKKPVRAMNLALGNMVFFARDLGFTVKPAKETPVDSEKIAARIESQLSGVRQLYRDELAKSPALAGSMVLQFNITTTGETHQMREVFSRIGDGEFRKAVVAEASKWSFSDMLTDNAQVTCALLFVHEGMDITTLVQWERALAESSDRPALARATGNATPSQPVKTVQAAPATDRPAAQRATGKSDGKQFQVKYAASLRTNPNFSAAVLTTLTIGTRVAVLNRPGEWLEVRTLPNGPTGFIRKEFIVPLEVAQQ